MKKFSRLNKADKVSALKSAGVEANSKQKSHDLDKLFTKLPLETQESIFNGMDPKSKNSGDSDVTMIGNEKLEYTLIDQIPIKVQSLRDTFKSGLTRTVSFRIAQLRQLNAMVEKEEQVIQKALFEDLGKSYAESFITEISVLKSSLANFINNLDSFMEPVPDTSKVSIHIGVKIETRREPWGVVCVIGPWNFPLLLTLSPLAGALAAGNTVLLKPSEIASNTARVLNNLLPKYLDSRVFEVVNGGVAESTELLAQKFDFIFFTGSTHVGKIVMQAAAKQLTPVLLELGGKSPCIVDKSLKHVEIAAKRISWAKTINSGQICIAPDYVLVHKSMAKEFVQYLIDGFKRIVPDGVETSTYSRIINLANHNRLQTMLEKQLKIPGTKLAYGGSSEADSLYFEPTILTGINPQLDNPVLESEIFGPILPIVEYDTLEEAIELVNKIGPQPLSLYPFTSEKSVYEKLIASIPCGNVVVGDLLVNLQVEDLPFGGVGTSGLGSYTGIHSLYAFTRPLAVMVTHSSFDFHNEGRYLPFDGKRNLGMYKFARWYLTPVVKGDFSLRIRKWVNKLVSRELVVLIIGLLVGYYSKRYFQ